MPEEITEQPTTAADIYAEIQKENGEPAKDPEADDPEETEAEDDPPASADEEPEDEAPDEEPEDEEDDLPLTGKLELDNEVREAFPEQAKRWDQQVKGLQKREKQLKDNEDGLAFWERVDNSLATKEAAAQALRELASISAKLTGLSVEELLGAPASDEEGPDPVSKYGFRYASDDAIFEAAVNKLKEDYGLDDIKADRERQQQERAEKEWLDRNAPRAIARAEKVANWPGITPDMVLKAKQEHPEDFKKDSVIALKKSFPDEYAASRSTAKKKLPTMIEGAGSRGLKIPDDPMEYSAAHAYAEINT